MVNMTSRFLDPRSHEHSSSFLRQDANCGGGVGTKVTTYVLQVVDFLDVCLPEAAVPPYREVGGKRILLPFFQELPDILSRLQRTP
jgi:hypothetical protein